MGTLPAKIGERQGTSWARSAKPDSVAVVVLGFVSRRSLVALSLVLCACDREPATKTASISELAGDAADFAAAIKAAQDLFKVPPQPLILVDNRRVPGAVMFEVKKGMDLVKAHRERFLGLGTTLFLARHGFDLKPDFVGLAHTTDELDLVTRVGTEAAGRGRYNAAVVAWLRGIDGREPFVLTGVGFDFVEGYFTGPIKEPERLAKEIHAFCPDFVNRGLGGGIEQTGSPEERIVAHFAKNRTFFFWWD